jgi:hypothetical protein
MKPTASVGTYCFDSLDSSGRDSNGPPTVTNQIVTDQVSAVWRVVDIVVLSLQATVRSAEGSTVALRSTIVVESKWWVSGPVCKAMHPSLLVPKLRCSTLHGDDMNALAGCGQVEV